MRSNKDIILNIFHSDCSFGSADVLAMRPISTRISHSVSNHTMEYRREIDGLRALAVLPVILFHAGFETFSGGFVGVDVFFVISGYLITTIILAELAQGKFSIVSFYERRARRILPALFLVMFVCIPFAWYLLLPSDLKGFSKSLVAVSVFASNILFWRESGYFNTAAELKPLLHTWSLAVEEQYYVIFPIFLMLFWRLGKRWILILLVVVFFASLAVAQWGAYAKPEAAFFLLPTRIWEFLFGVFTAFYLSGINRSDFSEGLSETCGWLGLALIFYAVFAYSKTTAFPGVNALVPTFGAMLVVIFATQKTFVGKFLGNKAFVFIGLISYSAYLWHQPIFAFLRFYTFDQISLPLNILSIAATFILSFFSLKYVETPFRKGSKVGRGSVFGLSAAGVFLFMFLGIYGNFNNDYSGKNSILTKAIGDWAHPGELKKTDIAGYYKVNEKKPVDVLFFGDSHAEQLAPLSRDIGVIGDNVGFLSGGGCPPIPDLLEDFHPHCFDLFDKLYEILSVEKSVKTIVVAGCFNCYFIGQSRSKPDVGDEYNYYFLKKGEKLYFRSGRGQGEALVSFKSFLQKLSLNAKVVVVGDNPEHYSFNPSVIFSFRARGDSEFFKSRYPDFRVNEFSIPADQLVLNKEIMSLVMNDFSFLNLFEIICPNSKCNSLSEDGNPIYIDGNHMRPGFVRESILPQFVKVL